MHHAPLERKEQIARRPILPVLPHRVRRRLLRQTVFELHRDERQSVDKDAEIEREPRPCGIAELTRHTENILIIKLLCLGVPLRRRHIIEREVCGAILNAAAQDVHDTALCDL